MLHFMFMSNIKIDMIKNVTINNNVKISLSYITDNYQYKSNNLSINFVYFNTEESPNNINASAYIYNSPTNTFNFIMEAVRDDNGFIESVKFPITPSQILDNNNILNHTYKLNITNITLKMYGAANHPTFTFNGKIPIDINDLNRTINVTVSRKGNSAFSHKNTDIFIAAYYQAKLNGTDEELGTPSMEYTVTISREYK